MVTGLHPIPSGRDWQALNSMRDSMISIDEAGTLYGLFLERVRRSPDAVAYRFYDAINRVWADHTWREMGREVTRCQAALAREDLKRGDRIAIMARNSRFWVMFDIAALGLGQVVVPLYTEDRVDNAEYIMLDAGVRLLVIGGEAQWQRLRGRLDKVPALKRIISIGDLGGEVKDKRCRSLNNWLDVEYREPELPDIDPHALATIVYTSGTTGSPKGVMLSHHNILSNAYAGLQTVPVQPGHVFLSFLPLSHTLERTIGYYLPMMADATVAHNRSIPQLAGDLEMIRPSVLISVPRIFERVYAKVKENLTEQDGYKRHLFDLAVAVGWRKFAHEQGRAGWHPQLLLWPLLKKLVADRITDRLGGRLKVAISGGAALAPEISRVFVSLGVPILQGYGLTEASPVVSVNRLDNNIPASIGIPLPGVEVRIGKGDELLVKGDNVMLGFWNNDQATAEVLDSDGWLHTGDKARIEGEHLYITGRIKDIIVLANGEKVSPTDMEMAISGDHLFSQIMIIGEGRPFLTALVVLNEGRWNKVAPEQNLDREHPDNKRLEKFLLDRISECLHEFPGYAQVRRVTRVLEQWTVENDLITPTLKIKRREIQSRYKNEIEGMYEGHTI